MQYFVKLNRLKCVVLLILSVCIIFGICGCSMDNSILDKLEEQGYKVEKTDNNSFFITEDGVDYYFDTIFNQIKFKKAVTTVKAKDEIKNLVNNEGEITVTSSGRNKAKVFLTTDSTSENNDGKEFITKGCTTLEFEGGFSEENITNNRGFHDTVGDYHYVTNYFMSADELKNLYDRALYLEDEIK